MRGDVFSLVVRLPQSIRFHQIFNQSNPGKETWSANGYTLSRACPMLGHDHLTPTPPARCRVNISTTPHSISFVDHLMKDVRSGEINECLLVLISVDVGLCSFLTALRKSPTWVESIHWLTSFMGQLLDSMVLSTQSRLTPEVFWLRPMLSIAHLAARCGGSGRLQKPFFQKACPVGLARAVGRDETLRIVFINSAQKYILNSFKKTIYIEFEWICVKWICVRWYEVVTQTSRVHGSWI